MPTRTIQLDGLETQPFCLHNHLGFWFVEPVFFVSAVSAIKSGTYAPQTYRLPAMFAALHAGAVTPEQSSALDRPLYHSDGSGVAIVPLHGHLTKQESKFGGTSTLLTRKALRAATKDGGVRAVLLHIDSPGGTVAGTADLAEEIMQTNEIKPTYAHIDDLGASAAYWAASQTRRITANKTAEIGSIGTVAVVEDSSEAAEAAGIKVHVVASGKYKGAFVDGAPITDSHLEYLQGRIDSLNEHFLVGVANGRRGRLKEDMATLADGRTHLATKAADLGLIDSVASFGEAREAILADIGEGVPLRKSDRFAVDKILLDKGCDPAH